MAPPDIRSQVMQGYKILLYTNKELPQYAETLLVAQTVILLQEIVWEGSMGDFLS